MFVLVLDKDQPCEVVIKFMCEREPAKQKYLSQAFPGIPLFEDMQELGNGSAKEYRTGNLQEVPKAFPVGCFPNGPSSVCWTDILQTAIW